MRDELYYGNVLDKLDTLRGEAATRRLLHMRVRLNLWARVLPTLRRLEAWVERHAGTPAQPTNRAAGVR